MRNANLFILGNGFDLQCGARTRYRDYFNRLLCLSVDNDNFDIDTLSNVVNEIYDKEPDTNLKKWVDNHIFDIIFLFFRKQECPYKTVGWFEVERILLDYLLETNKNKIDKLLSNLLLIPLELRTPCINSIIQKINSFDISTQEGSKEYSSYLLKSLMRWEYKFGNFIKSQTCVIEPYPDVCLENTQITWFKYEANTLLKKMLCITNNKTWDQTDMYDTYCISLNYSLPFNRRKDEYHPSELYFADNHIHNRHGVVNLFDSNIYDQIIGIDSNSIVGIEKNIDLDSFTKEIRIKRTNPMGKFDLPDSPINLIFYGISFAESDYSFIKSLFNKYNFFNNINNKIYLFTNSKFNQLIEFKIFIEKYSKEVGESKGFDDLLLNNQIICKNIDEIDINHP